MKPIRDAWCIQIELNNVCPGKCAYCTRFNKHLRKDLRYNMEPSHVATILDTLSAQGYTGNVGLIGGEPTIHPKFEECCQVVIDKWTRHGRWLALWTSGGPAFEKHRRLIDEAFSWVAYNDHKDPNCHHHRMTMASQDVVPDEDFRGELIDKCWVQQIWCPTINLKGAFFCECAAAWDVILDGPGGWSIYEPWLTYKPDDYAAQKWCCQLCGMAVPMEADPPFLKDELMSKSVIAMLTEHKANGVAAVPSEDFVDRKEYARRVDEWAPGEYTPGRAKGGAL